MIRLCKQGCTNFELVIHVILFGGDLEIFYKCTVINKEYVKSHDASLIVVVK